MPDIRYRLIYFLPADEPDELEPEEPDPDEFEPEGFVPGPADKALSAFPARP